MARLRPWLLLLCLSSGCAAAPAWRDVAVAEPVSPAAWAPLRLLDGYRATVSRVHGRRCNFEPSCSRYAGQAVQERGLLWGWVLAHGRLMRCTSCVTPTDYVWTRGPDGRPRLVDPVPPADTPGGPVERLVARHGVGKGVDRLKAEQASVPAPPPEPVPAPVPDRAFADRLYDDGWYARAWTEYRRYLFLHPQADEPGLRLRMARCLLADGEDESAAQALERVADTAAGRPESSEAAYLLGRIQAAGGAWPAAQAEFHWVIQQGGEAPTGAGPWAGEAAWALAWGDLARGDWDGATRALEAVPAGHPRRASADLAATRLAAARDLPVKSPRLATALSAVLPGAGHVYAGRTGDGLSAFFLNATFTLAAARAFDTDQDVLGGVLAFMELGWYAGNLYTAAGAAEAHNRAARRAFLDELSAQAPAPEPVAGLSARWEF